MRKHGRVDNNQVEIVQALRDAGATVLSMASLGNGAPDIAVGLFGHTYFLEIKGRNGKLTPDEIAWHAQWRGHVRMVRSVDEALAAIGAI